MTLYSYYLLPLQVNIFDCNLVWMNTFLLVLTVLTVLNFLLSVLTFFLNVLTAIALC